MGWGRGSSEPIFICGLPKWTLKPAWFSQGGMHLGNMVVNHLMFADDICVFSSGISGLQRLLNVCGDYAAEHEIAF